MKCFGFSYREKEEGRLSIELCQEILEYHVNRDDGIQITANIIVKSLTEEESYLCIWHRADVNPIRIDRTPQLTNPKDLFTHIFFNLREDRGSIIDNSTIEVKLFDENKTTESDLPEKEVENIKVPKLGEDCEIYISCPIVGELRKKEFQLPDSEYIPYTYAEIGPFHGENTYYAIRVTIEIDERSFHRCVPENFKLGVRYYQVYGAEEIIDNISDIDLPHLKRHSSENVYKIYSGRFDRGLCEKKLTPQFYSIVAIDSPNSSKFRSRRMYSIELKEGLNDLTDEIWDGLFKHKKLKSLKGRVFWFVNEHKNQNFMLWLEGPMAEAKVYA